jgi:hypothetical protein
MSGRSCSLAIRVFFVALLLAPEQVPYRDVTDNDPPLGQLVRKRARCDVSLLGDTGQHPIAFASKNARAMSAHLAWLEAAGGAKPRHQLDDGRGADAEVARRCPARHATINGGDNTNSEIMIERLCHGRWPPMPSNHDESLFEQKGNPCDSS